MEGSSHLLQFFRTLLRVRPLTATASTQTEDVERENDGDIQLPAEGLPTGCRRQEPTYLEETLTDFRIYVVWRIGDSRSLSGIHWGEGNSAYLGLLRCAGDLLGKLSFVRVKVKGSSSTWIGEAQRVWASRSGRQGREITPPVYQWLVLEV